MEQIRKAEERVAWSSYTKFLSCLCVAYQDQEGEIAGQVPVHVLILGRIRVEYLWDGGDHILGEGIGGHDVEKGEIGGQSSSALLDELNHGRNIGDLRGKRCWNGCLSWWKWESDICLLESSTVVGSISAHRDCSSGMLIGHYYSGFVVGFCSGEDSCFVEELSFDWRNIINGAWEKFVKSIASETKLAVFLLYLHQNGFYLILLLLFYWGFLYDLYLRQFLWVNLIKLNRYRLLLMLTKERAFKRITLGRLSSWMNLLISLIVKIIQWKWSIFIVANDHALVWMSNTTFVGNIGASQRIVSCYHYNPYFSFFQLLDCFFGLWF